MGVPLYPEKQNDTRKEGMYVDTVKRVQELISERDMTMYQLTVISGISYSTINTAQRRGGQLKIDTIERICEALNISLSEFFSSEAGKQPIMSAPGKREF